MSYQTLYLTIGLGLAIAIALITGIHFYLTHVAKEKYHQGKKPRWEHRRKDPSARYVAKARHEGTSEQAIREHLQETGHSEREIKRLMG